MRKIILVALFCTPFVVFGATKTIMDVAKMITTYINMAIAVMITAGVAIFMGSAVKTMGSSREGHEELKRVLGWGVLALFVMVSVWGLVALVKNTISI